MAKPRILLLSSSVVHGHTFLQYAEQEISEFLKKSEVSTILFVPYAATNYDAYLQKMREAIRPWGFQIESIHNTFNPTQALKAAQAIFVGGGNTFLLLKTLYDQNLLNVLRDRVLKGGVPYIGSSAGSNIAAPCIHNTNDMPLVYPPSFNALNFIPFNINPHYIEPNPQCTDGVETRDDRIAQYHTLPVKYTTYNVLGLREGCILHIEGETACLKGMAGARLFVRGQPARDISLGSDVTYLLHGHAKRGEEKVAVE